MGRETVFYFRFYGERGDGLEAHVGLLEPWQAEMIRKILDIDHPVLPERHNEILYRKFGRVS